MFKYDYNGLRTQKIVEADWYPVTTNYTLHGKLITHMNVNYYDWDEVEHNDTMHFFYDAQSRPAMVEFNGELYSYVHNLQGDIVGILDSLGNLMVEYKYDAWGKLLSATGWMADMLGARNPFRYRGYVYDEETGLYYLRSRYYSPIMLRFLNTDLYWGNGPLASRYNTFTYCFNAPLKYSDKNGSWPLMGMVNMLISAQKGATIAVMNVINSRLQRKSTSSEVTPSPSLAPSPTPSPIAPYQPPTLPPLPTSKPRFKPDPTPRPENGVIELGTTLDIGTDYVANITASAYVENGTIVAVGDPSVTVSGTLPIISYHVKNVGLNAEIRDGYVYVEGYFSVDKSIDIEFNDFFSINLSLFTQDIYTERLLY